MIKVIRLFLMIFALSNHFAWAAPSCPLANEDTVAFNDLAFYTHYDYLQRVDTTRQVYVCKYSVSAASMKAEIQLEASDFDLAETSNPIPINLEFTEDFTTGPIDLAAGNLFPELNVQGLEKAIPQLDANQGIFNFYVDTENTANNNDCTNKTGGYKSLQDNLYNYFTLDGRSPDSSSNDPNNIASFNIQLTNNTDVMNAKLVLYISNFSDTNPTRYSRCIGILCPSTIKRYFCWISVNSKLEIPADALKQLSKSGDYTFNATLRIKD